jgi:hypothetical protein
MRPARLPQSEEELPAWRVYADALLAAGDPLGQLLALELALPATANALELRQFHLVTRRRCRASRFLAVGWCLGHARTVAVVPEEGRRFVRSLERQLTVERLVELGNFLAKPAAQLVESLEVRLTPQLIGPFLKAVKHAPPTCTQLVLELWDVWGASAVERLISRLPPQIDRIALDAGSDDAIHFTGPRFKELDLRRLRYSPDALPLQHTRVLTWDLGLVRAGASPGLPGDAALLDLDLEELTLFPRPRLYAMQKRKGVISVLGQLRRSVPELHPVRGFQARGYAIPAFMRFVGGTWRVRADDEIVFVDGVEVAKGTSAPVVTGSKVSFAMDGSVEPQHRVFLEDAALWRSYSASA